MYNLLIHDYPNKCKFVYNLKPISDEEFLIVFDLVLKEIQSTISYNETHVSFITDHECEIYVYKELLEKGWLWNNLKPEKEILYKIETIACLETNLNFGHNKECQTESSQSSDIESQTDKIYKFNKTCQTIEEDESDYLFKSSESFHEKPWSYEFKQELQNKLNLENFGLYGLNKYKRD